MMREITREPVRMNSAKADWLSQPYTVLRGELVEEVSLNHELKEATKGFDALYNDVLSLEASYISSKKENESTTNSIASRLTLGFMDRAAPNPYRLTQIQAIVKDAKAIKAGIADSEFYEDCIQSYKDATLGLQGALLALRSQIKDGEYGHMWSSSPTNSKLFTVLDKAAEGKSEQQIKHAIEAYQVIKDGTTSDVQLEDGGMSYSVSI